MKVKDLQVGSKILFGRYCVENKSIESVKWIIGDNNHYKDENNIGIIDHITLVAEKIIDLRAFDAKEPNNTNSMRKENGNNRYSYSNQRLWLNSNELNWFKKQHDTDEPPANSNIDDNTGYDTKAGFLNLFSKKEINAIVPTNIVVAKAKVDGEGSEIVNDKVFLLSTTEVGLENENKIIEGKPFSIFSDNNSRQAALTKQCFDNTKCKYKPSSVDKNFKWVLRTPYTMDECGLKGVDSSGELDDFSAVNGNLGIRPTLNLNPEIELLDDKPDKNGYYYLDFKEEKTIWVDKETLVDAEKLNKIEDKIETLNEGMIHTHESKDIKFTSNQLFCTKEEKDKWNNSDKILESILKPLYYNTENASGNIINNNDCFNGKCFKGIIDKNKNEILSLSLINNFPVPYTIGIRMKISELISGDKDIVSFYDNDTLIGSINSMSIVEKDKWIFRNVYYSPAKKGKTSISIKTNENPNITSDILVENIYFIPLGLAALI